MNKVLFLGGSHGDIPVIQAAKSLGFFVITSGTASSDLGHSYGDQYVSGDFSNALEMAEIVKRFDCDYVCSSTNDFSEISASFISEQNSIPGYDSFITAESLHHKDSFRAICERLDISVPKSISMQLKAGSDSLHDNLGSLTFPVLIKPVDLSGGKGIKFCRDSYELDRELQDCFDSRSKTSRIVIEEFIEGTNHAASFIVSQGQFLFEFFDSEHYGANKYLVAGTSTCHSLSEEIKEIVRQNVWHLVNNLELCDGLVHVQYILRESTVFFIEVTRRTPGDLYTRFVELATGFNYSRAIFSSKIGRRIETQEQLGVQRHISRLSLHPSRNGLLGGFSIDQRAKNHLIEFFDLNKKSITDYGQEKLGIGFFEFETEIEQNAFVSNFNDFVSYTFVD